MQRARQASRAPPDNEAGAWSATTSSPSVAVSSPAASASQVDLPLPDAPRSSSVPPCGTTTSSKRSAACPRG